MKKKNKSNRGGARRGAGRPRGSGTPGITTTFRIAPDAAEALAALAAHEGISRSRALEKMIIENKSSVS